MADVAPELYDELESMFRKALAGDKKAAALLKKISSGKGGYIDAGDYADCVSKAMNTAFKSTLSSDALPDGKMYWNIAERTIEPLYEESYDLIVAAAVAAQQSINTVAHLGLKAQATDYNAGVATTIMNELCDAERYDDVAYKLYDSADMYAREVVDDTMQANADFQGASGVKVMLVRTAEPDCCEWCTEQEGIYEYPNIPAEIYKRHANCKCDITYTVTGGHAAQTSQKTVADAEKVEARKTFGGLESTVDREKLKTFNL